MKFDAIKYMEWVKTQPKAEYDLRRSGVDRYPLKNLSFPFEETELTGHNVYGYPRLLDELAVRYGVPPDNVISCLGTSQALFLVCAALLREGDEVVVEDPAYEPLISVPVSLGARLLKLDRSFDAGYAWDPADLSRRLTPRSRLLIITNLHNPSGNYQSPAKIREAAQLVSEYGGWVLVDEVYLEFLEGERAVSSLCQADNIIVISSLTKVYGLGGIRSGWVIAPPEISSVMRRIIDHIHVEHVYLSEKIALHALKNLDEIRAYHAPRLKQNLALMRDFMRNESRLSWVEPDGGIVCFPRLEMGPESGPFCRHLRDRYDTAVVPGRFFGAPRHFRLAYGVKTEILEQGLENISRALRDMGNPV